jgi:hypothetical protein
VRKHSISPCILFVKHMFFPVWEGWMFSESGLLALAGIEKRATMAHAARRHAFAAGSKLTDSESRGTHEPHVSPPMRPIDEVFNELHVDMQLDSMA